MSLYNAIFGVNDLAPAYLAFAGVPLKEIPRFRDAYLEKDQEGNPVICIYTRVGGGNRQCSECTEEQEKAGKHEPDCWKGMILKLQAKLNFIEDYDDDFDCTYATFKFRPLPQYLDMTNSFLKNGNGGDHHDWESFLSDLKEGKQTPHTQNAMEFGKKTLKPIVDEVESGKIKGKIYTV